jgi:hypothetical protein
MSAASGGAEVRIPLPPGASLARDTAGAPCAGLVAAFLERTDALSYESAAELAGVQPDTIRKWRRRLPRWLRASTARRLTAFVEGRDPAPPSDGFRALFRRVLRSAPPD